MKIKAFAVIDTNVIISGLLSPSFPRDVLNLVQSKNVVPIFDKRMLNEYYNVLGRKEKYNFSEQTIYDILYSLVDNGIFINDVERAKVQLKDNDDIPFFEVKESSEEFGSYLVTGNLKHFPESASTLNPKEFLNILNTLERFVKRDFDYAKCVEELMATQLSTSKFTYGTELIDKMFDTRTQIIKTTFLGQS